MQGFTSVQVRIPAFSFNGERVPGIMQIVKYEITIWTIYICQLTSLGIAVTGDFCYSEV